MQTPDLPADETARLAELASLDVLDQPADPALDALTRIAARLLDVPVALVSLVDRNRQWFASRQGLQATQTPRDISFCGHVVACGSPMVVADAHADPRFADNPLVTGPPHVGFYVGVPLTTSRGHVLGTLCAIDHAPRTPDPEAVGLLGDLARQVLEHFELRRRSEALRQAHDELAVRSQLQALAEAEARVGHWTLDVADGWMWWSDGMYPLLGRSRDLGPPTLASAFAHLAPPDRQAMHRAIEASGAEGRSFRQVVSVQHEEGARSRLVVSGRSLPEDGRARVIGLCRALGGDGAREAPQPERPSALAARPGRVLVIDDDPRVGKLLARALRPHRADIHTDPALAVAHLRQHGEDYDLVVCDLGMPYLGGVAVYEAVPAAVQQRMVFITGGLTRPELEAFEERMGQRVLSKPIDLDRLRAMIDGATWFGGAPERRA